MKYSRRKPTKPGWYWCQNQGDKRGETWEGVVRIEQTADGLHCCWLTSQLTSGFMHERFWSEEALWAGPLTPPENVIATAPQWGDPEQP